MNKVKIGVSDDDLVSKASKKITLISLWAILGDFLELPFRALCVPVKIALLPNGRNKTYSPGYV